MGFQVTLADWAYLLMCLGAIVYCLGHILSWKMGTTLKKNLSVTLIEHEKRRRSGLTLAEALVPHHSETSYLRYLRLLARRYSETSDFPVRLASTGILLGVIGIGSYLTEQVMSYVQ